MLLVLFLALLNNNRKSTAVILCFMTALQLASLRKYPQIFLTPNNIKVNYTAFVLSDSNRP